MNKLAFFGIIILGLMFLLTHWAVTLIIGLGPQFVTNSYDMMQRLEAFNENLAVEVKKSAEDEWIKYQEEVKEKELKRATAKKTPLYSKKDFVESKQSIDQNDINRTIRVVKKEVQDLKPNTIEQSFSFQVEGPSFELDTWVAMYGLVGSLLIIFATTLLAIASLAATATGKFTVSDR